MGRARDRKLARLEAEKALTESRAETGCVNVMHNAITCAAAEFPLEQWCEPCKARARKLLDRAALIGEDDV